MATSKRIQKSVAVIGKTDRNSISERRTRSAGVVVGSKNQDRPATATAKRTSAETSHKALKARESTTRRSTGRRPKTDIAFRAGSTGAAVVSLLNKKDGATIAEMTEATGWQAHSVRGFLSGSLKKKRGLAIASERGDDGQRRYRIAT